MAINGQSQNLFDSATGQFASITSDGLLVRATSLPLPTGAATEASLAGLSTEATLLLVKAAIEDVTAEFAGLATEVTAAAIAGKLDDVKTKLDTVNTNLGTINTSLGTVNTSVGAVTTAVGTVNTSVGTVNTSVQAVKTSVDAAKASIDSMSAKIPALGQAAMAASQPVVIASDQPAIATKDQKAAGATLSSVSGSTSSVELLDANSSRRAVVLHNDSNAIAYVAFAATASSSAYTYKMYPNATLELSQVVTAGKIAAIWTVANGAMKITELT